MATRCSSIKAADFTLEAVDPSGARAGHLLTPHGLVRTPAFMPVGTYGAVKTVTPDELREAGTQVVLANTYHLSLRPGSALVRSLGGLHGFMAWPGPILTDSGGFQIMSLSARSRVDEEGVVFASHLDGSRQALTPERAVAIQEDLGTDIAMVLDHVVPPTADRRTVEDAMERTLRWACRCREARTARDMALFGIVQGGVYADLRERCAHALVDQGYDGYAVGGLALGESRGATWEAVEAAAPSLPADRPRYLMGMGTPQDLLDGIARGMDLFDCVMPTRNARNGTLFTSRGRLSIKTAAMREDSAAPDPACECFTCRRFSRAYLRHLFTTGEMLGFRLNTIHNLSYYHRLVSGCRAAIGAGAFADYRRGVETGWGESGPEGADCL